MSKKTLISLLVLYLISAVTSYLVFSRLGGQTISLTPGSSSSDSEVLVDDELSELALLDINPSEPKNQACPLNGALYTATEQAAWEQRRPLAVMIENSPDARPQSGMGSADIVFEAVAEGGVTRFMGMFYCDVQRYDTTLAPIRSARTHFVNLASGFNLPLYVHVGGANLPGPTNALGQLEDYGWVGQNDLNQFSIGYPTFVRDYNRIPGKEIATEHTMVTTTEKLWAVGEKRGWTNMSPARTTGRTTVPGSDWKTGYTGWAFVDGNASSNSQTISYDFWSGFNLYSVEWTYDVATNTYQRKHGGEVHVDMNTDQPVAVSNVVVMLVPEKGPINEAKHMIYDVIGTGKALIFKDGQTIEATWTKKDRVSELQFAAKGQPVEFTRGKVWVSVVGNTVDVQY